MSHPNLNTIGLISNIYHVRFATSLVGSGCDGGNAAWTNRGDSNKALAFWQTSISTQKLGII
jgi:hypothetical protein